MTYVMRLVALGATNHTLQAARGKVWSVGGNLPLSGESCIYFKLALFLRPKLQM